MGAVLKTVNTGGQPTFAAFRRKGSDAQKAEFANLAIFAHLGCETCSWIKTLRGIGVLSLPRRQPE